MASEAPRTAQVGPRTMIERVPSDRNLTNVIEQWKALRPEWDVTALVAPDKKTVVFLAYKEEP